MAQHKSYTQAKGERTLARVIVREMQALGVSIADPGARRRAV
jgi:hypothetical protein